MLLVLRALGVGDLLTAVPALRALASAFPHHRRVLAAPRQLLPLIKLSGTVHATVDTRPLAPVELDRRPAVGVNLHGRGPQSHTVLLATRPERMIAFAHGEIPESYGHPQWRPGEHEVERWCRLLAEEGIPADRSLVDLPAPARPVPDFARDATVVHPGAADPARRWPAERFAAVARAELTAGRAVIVTGTREEIPLAEEIAGRAGLPGRWVMAGKTDLGCLAALVAAAGRVVCGDTGVAHLATAFRTPSVVLFGPVAPACWGPPPDRGWHRVLWAGRTGDPHGAEVDPGLLEITVADVLDALATLPTPPR
ncbi:MAG: glycosyltransferase family 9 protein [Actinobacteria bacterium]|nr:glycosyltransferase family 9 protein [Actinomycetota bacterium]